MILPKPNQVVLMAKLSQIVVVSHMSTTMKAFHDVVR